MTTATKPRAKTGVFLTAGWYHLAMLNFPIAAHLLEPFVPAGTELDTWQGRPYVSVVGFQFLDSAVLGIPLFFHRKFEEVNLRFYVVRRTPTETRRGVVFLREIAPKPLISWAARWFYNEQYITMPMRHDLRWDGDGTATHVEYGWRHAGRWNGLALETSGKPTPLTPGSEEEFIAEHYWGYARQRDGTTMEYAVEHPPWRIQPVTATHYDCDVEAIYGQEFVPYLKAPASAFVADGSPVVVRRGRRL